MDLEGKTILVTGASRGLGRALVERLADEPVRVLCGVRDPAGFEPIGGDARVVEFDLGSRESIDTGLAALGEERARIDVSSTTPGSSSAGCWRTSRSTTSTRWCR
jgi:3-oxoacyl-[acyl-carrier protein] reductase